MKRLLNIAKAAAAISLVVAFAPLLALGCALANRNGALGTEPWGPK